MEILKEIINKTMAPMKPEKHCKDCKKVIEREGRDKHRYWILEYCNSCRVTHRRKHWAGNPTERKPPRDMSKYLTE